MQTISISSIGLKHIHYLHIVYRLFVYCMNGSVLVKLKSQINYIYHMWGTVWAQSFRIGIGLDQILKMGCSKV